MSNQTLIPEDNVSSKQKKPISQETLKPENQHQLFKDSMGNSNAIEMKPSHHTKTYVILGSLILLALLVLIATYFVNRKSESKNENNQVNTTLIIFIILLSGCDSSGKDKRKIVRKQKNFESYQLQ